MSLLILPPVSLGPHWVAGGVHAAEKADFELGCSHCDYFVAYYHKVVNKK